MKKKHYNIILAVIAVIMIMTSPVGATVIGGEVTGGGALVYGGTFVDLTPADGIVVGNDTFQDNNLYAFDEDQNISLNADVTAGLGSGDYVSLPEGTVVASHYVFFDPGPLMSLTGYVEFDSEVIGIMTTKFGLAATDYLANVDVTYLSPDLRGLEYADAITIDEFNPNRINIDFVAQTPGDYIRVFTAESPAAVPEPSTMLLLGSGVIGMLGARRFV